MENFFDCFPQQSSLIPRSGSKHTRPAINSTLVLVYSYVTHSGMCA
jgi:hypothetical protein